MKQMSWKGLFITIYPRIILFYARKPAVRFFVKLQSEI